jgi:prevent-host-death family protein
MEHTVSATEARIHFGELTQTAVEKGEPIIVERVGKAPIVILSVDVYWRLLQGQRQESWQALVDRVCSRIRADLAGRELPSPDEVLR